MSEEFSTLPNMDFLLAQRIAAKHSGAQPNPTKAFDPYQSLMNKKNGDVSPVDPETVQQWPEKEVKELQDYCQRMGILGFNCGRMHPVAALAMLKKQFGDYSNVPLEERVPEGYEKMGTKSTYGPNYPYSQAMQKKQILHD